MSVFSDVSLVVVNNTQTQTQLIITIRCHSLINHSDWNKVNLQILSPNLQNLNWVDVDQTTKCS